VTGGEASEAQASAWHITFRGTKHLLYSPSIGTLPPAGGMWSGNMVALQKAGMACFQAGSGHFLWCLFLLLLTVAHSVLMEVSTKGGRQRREEGKEEEEGEDGGGGRATCRWASHLWQGGSLCRCSVCGVWLASCLWLAGLLCIVTCLYTTDWHCLAATRRGRRCGDSTRGSINGA